MRDTHLYFRRPVAGFNESLGARVFEVVLFTDDTETPVNVLIGETPAHS